MNVSVPEKEKRGLVCVCRYSTNHAPPPPLRRSIDGPIGRSNFSRDGVKLDGCLHLPHHVERQLLLEGRSHDLWNRHRSYIDFIATTCRFQGKRRAEFGKTAPWSTEMAGRARPIGRHRCQQE